MTTVDTGLEIIEHLDFAFTPPCESRVHTSDRGVHAGPAYALVRFTPPCGHVTEGYRCRPLVGYGLAGGWFHCHDCRVQFVGHMTILALVGDA